MPKIGTNFSHFYFKSYQAVMTIIISDREEDISLVKTEWVREVS